MLQFEELANYVPEDDESSSFLSDIPISLVKNSLESQFECPLEYRKIDYLQKFFDRYENSKSLADNDDDMSDNDQIYIEEMYDQFMAFLPQLFNNYLRLGFPDIELLDDDDRQELYQMTYKFFIKDIKKNFIALVYHYIENHYQELVDTLPRKKDVTTVNFKIEIENDDDVTILSNLSTIIDTALEQPYSVEEFFDYCQTTSSSIELEYMINAFNNAQINGNFVQAYIAMIDEDFKFEIETKIRGKILKKYPIRKKDTSKEEKREAELAEENESEESNSEEN